MSRTTIMKNVLATAYGADITAIGLFTTDPGSTGTSNELVGGLYARVPPGTIPSASGGAISFQVIINVPAGEVVGGGGFWDVSGNFLDGGPVVPQTFASAGTYALTVIYTQT